MAGRPSEFSEEIAAQICELIANGESLRAVCSLETMPHAATVCRWLRAREPFREQYARAREAQADALFDEILDIADDGTNDWMLRKRGDQEAWVENGEALRRSHLRVEARKWMAAKLQPKKYGERIETKTTLGVDGSIVALLDRISTSGKRVTDR